MAARIADVRRNCAWLRECEQHEGRLDRLQLLSSGANLSQKIKKKLAARLMKSAQNQHTQQAIEAKFGPLMARIAEELMEAEAYPCCVCDLLHYSSRVSDS